MQNEIEDNKCTKVVIKKSISNIFYVVYNYYIQVFEQIVKGFIQVVIQVYLIHIGWKFHTMIVRMTLQIKFLKRVLRFLELVST